MTVVPTASRLTIFEGPDGGGKSTIARWFAEATDARYVHCGPLKDATKSLARYYAEAMCPALMGYQDVVMDRCWISEEPYGRAFRGGDDRIGPDNRAMLERLAARCAALVVLCMPPWETVLKNWRDRRGDEMLTEESQLRHVYDIYQAMGARSIGLPVYRHDYTVDALEPFEVPRNSGIRGGPQIDALRSIAHWKNKSTCGVVSDRLSVVVTELPQHRNGEMWYRFPGVSFRPDSAEWWLQRQLREFEADRRTVLWASAAEDLTYLRYMAQDVGANRLGLTRNWRFAALGAGAIMLRSLNISHEWFDSASFRRDLFGADRHPIVDWIKEGP